MLKFSLGSFSAASALLAQALLLPIAPSVAQPAVSWVGVVGPDDQGRIPRFAAGGCADSEPGFHWLTKDVPVAAAAPPPGTPSGPLGEVVVIAEPEDPRDRHVPLDTDKLGGAVGFVRTLSHRAHEDVREDGGGGLGHPGMAAKEKPAHAGPPFGGGFLPGHAAKEEPPADVAPPSGGGGGSVGALPSLPAAPATLFLSDLDSFRAAHFHDGAVTLLETPDGHNSIAYAMEKAAVDGSGGGGGGPGDKRRVSEHIPRWIVGMIHDEETGEETAVVWIDGALSRLEDAIPTAEGWDLRAATDLDDRGYVLGLGRLWGERVVFVARLQADVAKKASEPIDGAKPTENEDSGGRARDNAFRQPNPVVSEKKKIEEDGGHEDKNSHTGIPIGPPNVDFCGLRRPSGRGTGCNNGDFEYGTLSEWTARNSDAGFTPWTTGVINGRQTIMTTADGFDPELAAMGISLPVVAPGSGDFSVRLGNNESGKFSEMLLRSFVVTPETANFRYTFAAVLENPAGHTEDDQPAFFATVYEGSPPGLTIDDIIEQQEYVADGSDPFFVNAGSELLYTPWRCNSIDLSEYVGQAVTVVFRTRDCGQYGHFGYVYIDNVCGDDSAASGDPVIDMDTTICPSSGGIVADGSGSGGVINAHFWSVQESTSGWAAFGPEITQWFDGFPGVMDIEAFAASGGLVMRCGRYYRVKLAVSNECTPWASTTMLVHVNCPVIDAGPDQWICLGDSTEISVAPDPYDWLGWTTSGGAFVSSSETTTIAPSVTTTYIATVEDTTNSDCEGWDDVTVHVVTLPVATIQHEPVCGDCTNPRVLRAVAGGQELIPDATFLWSTGETTPTITVPNPTYENYQIEYSCTVTTPCGVVFASTTVEHISELDFIAPNAFTPEDGENSIFTVWHWGTSAGIAPAYGYHTKFRIFNGWGGVIHEQEVRCEDMAPNGALEWDGKYLGNYVKTPEVYPYQLEYVACSGKNVTIEDYFVVALK